MRTCVRGHLVFRDAAEDFGSEGHFCGEPVLALARGKRFFGREGGEPGRAGAEAADLVLPEGPVCVCVCVCVCSRFSRRCPLKRNGRR